MSAISLVAFDLDGTLLDSSSRIRRDSLEAIIRLQEEGVFITLITGRSYASTETYAKQLNLFTPFGLVHGAHVRDLQGLDLSKRVIPEVGILEALNLSREMNLIPLIVDLASEGGLTVCEEHREHPIVRFVLSPRGSDAELQGAKANFLPSAQIKTQAYAVYLIGENEGVERFLTATTEQKVKIYNSGEFPVRSARSESILGKTHSVAMLSPIGADKGAALEAVAETLGVSLEHTLAFGDWHNDLPMLKKAGYAAVMGNAPTEILRDLGRGRNVYRTGSNDATGIVDALVRFGLL